MTMQSDEQLLSRAREGDQKALERLLVEAGLVASRRIRGRIPHRWQSVLTEDDVIQQTYADAARSINSFRSETVASFIAWLTTIAERNLINAIEMLEAGFRGGSWRPVSPRSTSDSRVDFLDLIADGSTPSRKVGRQEAIAALEQAIAQLPDNYARVVKMYDLEGRPLSEVCEQLDRTAGAVYMLRSRAIERLRSLMGSGSKYMFSR